jgi:hypothetical protein
LAKIARVLNHIPARNPRIDPFSPAREEINLADQISLSASKVEYTVPGRQVTFTQESPGWLRKIPP